MSLPWKLQNFVNQHHDKPREIDTLGAKFESMKITFTLSRTVNGVIMFAIIDTSNFRRH